MFKKATKKDSRLRMALIGPSGSGKTYTSLSLATALGGPIAVIDTERGTASKYSDMFDFDVVEPSTFHPDVYIRAIEDAEKEGYSVLIIDSLSHAWMGRDGALEQVDKVAARTQSKNSFAAWREVTPLHNRLVDAILDSKLHIIATIRSKMEYVMESGERGKSEVRKVGMQPIQRDGLEYEFDVVGDLDQDNNLIITKTRCPALHGKIYRRAGKEVINLLVPWLAGKTEEEIKKEEVMIKLQNLQKQLEELGYTPPLTQEQLIELSLEDLRNYGNELLSKRKEIESQNERKAA